MLLSSKAMCRALQTPRTSPACSLLRTCWLISSMGSRPSRRSCAITASRDSPSRAPTRTEPEGVAARVKLGTEYELVLDGGKEPVRAKISEIAPVADSASRTVLVKLPLPAGCVTGIGSFGRLYLPAAESAMSVVVPESAVVVRGQLEMVFVVGDGRAAMRLVKVGGKRAGEVQILSGLKAGEQVVTAGAEMLMDGQSVGR